MHVVDCRQHDITVMFASISIFATQSNNV